MGLQGNPESETPLWNSFVGCDAHVFLATNIHFLFFTWNKFFQVWNVPNEKKKRTPQLLKGSWEHLWETWVLFTLSFKAKPGLPLAFEPRPWNLGQWRNELSIFGKIHFRQNTVLSWIPPWFKNACRYGLKMWRIGFSSYRLGPRPVLVCMTEFYYMWLALWDPFVANPTSPQYFEGVKMQKNRLQTQWPVFFWHTLVIHLNRRWKTFLFSSAVFLGTFPSFYLFQPPHCTSWCQHCWLLLPYLSGM